MSTTSSPTEFALDPTSVKKVLGDKTTQVMVYGFGHAKYLEIQTFLKKETTSIRKVFDLSVGEPKTDPTKRTTLEGSIIEQLPVDPIIQPPSVKTPKQSSTHEAARKCKAGIANLIFENYKRKKTGLPVIPLLFCVESEDTPEWNPSAHSLSSKESSLNALVTHSELRRAYKLCSEFSKSKESELQELAEVARDTLRFVRLEKQPDGAHKLVPVKPVWEGPGWEKEWQARLDTDPVLRKEKQMYKKSKWRELILKKIQSFNKNSSLPIKNSKEFFVLAQKYYTFLNERKITDVSTCKNLLKSDPDAPTELKKFADDPQLSVFHKDVLELMGELP